MRKKIDYLIIGKIAKPSGNRGELKVFPITDNIERFNNLAFVFLKEDQLFTKYKLESVRHSHKSVFLKFKDHDSRNDVEKLRGKNLYINRKNAIKIDESSYYYYDITGCTVKTTSGNILGEVYDIQNAGSCDIYVVESEDNKGKFVFIPAIKEVVKKIDINRKEIIIEVIEGLL